MKSTDRNLEKFRELVEENKRWAYAVAYAFVGDGMTAYDISQQAFVRVWKNFKRWKPEIGFRSWLYKIIRNLSLEHLKRNRRRNEVSLESVPPARTLSNPETEVMDEEMKKIVWEAIYQLPAEQQDVIILVDINGMKYREVAEILDIPMGTVMSRLYYARRKLAEMLKDYWEGRI